VHPVGGNVLCYVDLARRLGPDQPFYGLQHPGLYDDRRPFTRIQAMAAHYIDALRTLQPEGPYLLGGWSMGALAAFEMAAQLRAQGESVAVLALLDPPAPIAPDRADYQADGATLLARFARDYGLALEDAALSWEHFRQLGPDAQLSYLLAQARAANLVTSAVDLKQLGRHLRVFLANDRARRRYTPQHYAGRITLIRAAERAVSSDLALGWSRWAAGGVDVYTLPGDHYTLLKDPHVRALAERLQVCLDGE
jgi:thioesterase domain-containing protein